MSRLVSTGETTSGKEQIVRNYDGQQLSFETPNRMVKSVRTILIGGQPKQYEFMLQVASGPCVVATFMNLWSFLHDGKLPNMQIPKIEEGISRKRLEEMFSLLYGGEPISEDIIEINHHLSESGRLEKSRFILDLMDTYEEGTLVCGLAGHCTAIQRYEDVWVKVDPFNEQGLQVFDDRDGLAIDIAARMGRAGSDYFHFPHH